MFWEDACFQGLWVISCFVFQCPVAYKVLLFSLICWLRIVEANPRKFNLDATELSIRKAFITSTRQIVRVRSKPCCVVCARGRHTGQSPPQSQLAG